MIHDVYKPKEALILWPYELVRKHTMLLNQDYHQPAHVPLTMSCTKGFLPSHENRNRKRMYCVYESAAD